MAELGVLADNIFISTLLRILPTLLATQSVTMPHQDLNHGRIAAQMFRLAQIFHNRSPSLISYLNLFSLRRNTAALPLAAILISLTQNLMEGDVHHARTEIDFDLARSQIANSKSEFSAISRRHLPVEKRQSRPKQRCPRKNNSHKIDWQVYFFNGFHQIIFPGLKNKSGDFLLLIFRD